MKIFWKIYLSVFTLILLFGYLGNIAFFSSHPFFTIFDLAISLPSIIGLYNYAFKRAYLPMNFWKIYAVAFPVYEIILNIFIAPEIFEYTPTVLVTTLSALPFLPLYIALALYAYKKS